jgi:hypothetical protein
MMTDNKLTDVRDVMAKIISFIFHPLFMPLYGIWIIFSAPTILGYLPVEVKKILSFIILVNNVLIPITLMPFFRYRNVISSYNIDERRERVTPLLATTLLYSITTIIIFRFQIPLFLKSFIIACSFLVLSVSIINFWWKISIHSVGVGALTAVVIILSVKMYTFLTWYLVGVILAGGLVLSSRLRLNVHNPPQVWVGYAAGFLGLFLFMLIF